MTGHAYDPPAKDDSGWLGPSDAEDELTVCPRCGSAIYWVQLFDDRPNEQFAMCTRCNWGED